MLKDAKPVHLPWCSCPQCVAVDPKAVLEAASCVEPRNVSVIRREEPSFSQAPPIQPQADPFGAPFATADDDISRVLTTDKGLRVTTYMSDDFAVAEASKDSFGASIVAKRRTPGILAWIHKIAIDRLGSTFGYYEGAPVGRFRRVSTKPAVNSDASYACLIKEMRRCGFGLGLSVVSKDASELVFKMTTKGKEPGSINVTVRRTGSSDSVYIGRIHANGTHSIKTSGLTSYEVDVVRGVADQSPWLSLPAAAVASTSRDLQMLFRTTS